MGRKEVRKYHSENTKKPRHPGTNSNKGKHVQVPGFDRSPGTLKEHPGGVEYHRQRQSKLYPVPSLHAHPFINWVAGDHFSHGNKKDGQRKCHRNFELFNELIIGFLFSGKVWFYSYEIHSADGAASRLILLNFRMHGAGVLIRLYGQTDFFHQIHSADRAVPRLIVSFVPLTMHGAVICSGAFSLWFFGFRRCRGILAR